MKLEDGGTRLRIQWSAANRDFGTSSPLILGLPPRSIDRLPSGFALNIGGDGGGSTIEILVTDANNDRYAYSFEPIHFRGPGRCIATRVSAFVAHDADAAKNTHNAGSLRASPDPLPPLHPYQIHFLPADSSRAFLVILKSLSVLGDVRIMAPGIA